MIRYTPQQHYHSHHDFFDPTQNPSTPGLREGYNRMITLLWYLNDVEEGKKKPKKNQKVFRFF